MKKQKGIKRTDFNWNLSYSENARRLKCSRQNVWQKKNITILMNKKRSHVYRKRQWTRQAARKFAKVAKRWARKKPKWHKSLSNVADLASAYAIGKMLQVRLLNSAGVEIGWRDEPNPFKWINEMPDALRVKPKEKKPCSH